MGNDKRLEKGRVRIEFCLIEGKNAAIEGGLPEFFVWQALSFWAVIKGILKTHWLPRCRLSGGDGRSFVERQACY